MINWPRSQASHASHAAAHSIVRCCFWKMRADWGGLMFMYVWMQSSIHLCVLTRWYIRLTALVGEHTSTDVDLG